MLVERTKRTEKVKFKELKPGDVFYESDNEDNLKMKVAPYFIAEANGTIYQAIYLANGAHGFMNLHDEVVLVNGRFKED